MKFFVSKLSTCVEDIYLRVDEKYHSAINNNAFNLFNTNNNVSLSDILVEDYTLFDYSDGNEHKGVPTGQNYIDEDGDIIDWQLVTDDNHPNRLKYSISDEHILLSSLRLAKSPALNYEFENINDYVFSNGFYIFKVKQGWDKRFVLFLLRSKKLKRLIDEKIYRGIGISSYKISDLFKVNIRNLSLSEQISAVNAIIPVDNQIKVLKREKLNIQSIIDAVLKREFGFDYDKFDELRKTSRYSDSMVAFANNPDLRFSAKFHRPAGEFVRQELNRITERKIKHYLAEPIILGASVSPSDYNENGEYQYLSMATIKNWEFDNETAQFVSISYSNSKTDKSIKCGDLILARSGEGTIGKVAIIEREDVKAIFADFIMRIRLKNYNPKFAYYYMRSTYFQYLVEIHKKGLGNNTNIFPIVVREFPIPGISLQEQQRIVDEIQTEINKQNEIKIQIDSLRSKIDSIIENAIIG